MSLSRQSLALIMTTAMPEKNYQKLAGNTNRVDTFIGVETATVNLHRQKLADVVDNQTTKTHYTLPLFTAQHSGKPHITHSTSLTKSDINANEPKSSSRKTL